MKRSIQMNLGGSIFFIDEDAYLKLEKYLKSIKEYLKNSEEQDEILQDIEMRIAELLLENRSSKQEAVDISHIDEVIEIMGQPEDYRLEEDGEEPPKATERVIKRLYRDGEDRFIAGVASGLAHYVGIDPVWMRLICVLIVLAGVGSPIFIYILLWILVPEAITTSEKLHMKGKSANFSNIEKTLKEEYANVANKVKDADIKGMANNLKKRSASFFDWLLCVGKFFVRAFVIFLGVVLLITSFAVIVSLIVMLFIPENNLFSSGIRLGRNIYSINNTGVSVASFWIFKTASYLSVIIPFVFLFILSLFAINPKMKQVGRYTKTGLLLVWIIAVATTIYYVASIESASKHRGRSVERVDLALSKTDTLLLNTSLHPRLSNIHTNSDYLIQNDSLGGQYVYSKNFNIQIQPTDDLYASILIERSASSSAIDKANNLAEEIDYSYSFDENTLTLDSYFILHNTMQNNNSKVKVYLNIPKDMFFKLDNHSAKRSYKKNRDDQIVAWELLQINNKIIECISCEKEETTESIDKNTEKDTETSDWEKKIEEAFNSL